MKLIRKYTAKIIVYISVTIVTIVLFPMIVFHWATEELKNEAP